MVIPRIKMLWADTPKRKDSEVTFSSETRAEYLRERLGQLREAKNILYDEDISLDEESLHNVLEALQSENDRISEIRDQFMGSTYICHAAVYTGDHYEEITAFGSFCIYRDGSIWLECRSSHDHDVHLIKLTKEYEVDSDWLNSNSLLDEESAEREHDDLQRSQQIEDGLDLARDLGYFDD
jgi:hypothetical protein